MRHRDAKTEFETGAHRDESTEKGRPSLISPIFMYRLALHLERGAEHYGADNWKKGMTYRRTADSLIRHIYQWLMSDEEEDHLAAIACNVMFLMHYETALDCGSLPQALDDRGSDLDLKDFLMKMWTGGAEHARMEAEGRNIAETELSNMGQASWHKNDKGELTHGTL